MFFKNLSAYRISINCDLSSTVLNDLLATHTLHPCGSTDAQSIGWVNPSSTGDLAHVVNSQILLALGAEKKLLPASVVRQFANERAKTIEENEGRRIGRKEMRDLREAMTFELMPRAFIRQHITFGWIDPVNGWLVIDSAAPAKAEEFLEHLRKSINGLDVSLLNTKMSATAAMTAWVAEGEAPAGFTIDQDLRLCSAENAQVTYAKHTLEGEEIRQQIAEGKVATKLAMTWNDRISFVLTDRQQIKRLAFLDILKEQNDGQAENEAERFDLDFTLMSGEVARLLRDLVAALGGEIAEQAAKAEPSVQRSDKLSELNSRLSELAPDVAYDEAVKVVLENRRVSISLVQRHLRIGYNHAARLIEKMEQNGLVSAQDSNGVRTLLGGEAGKAYPVAQGSEK